MQNTISNAVMDRRTRTRIRNQKDWKQNWSVYLLFLPAVVLFGIFNYAPMFGIVMAFENFKPTKGFFGSKWVGMANFMDLFSSEEFLTVFRNTVVMAFMNLTIGFVFPIVLALLLSELTSKKFRRVVQTVSYMPYFIATVVVCTLITNFCDTQGIVTDILVAFGAERENLLANPKYFWWINTFSEVWQGMGYGSIIYVAAISNINPNLYEAAAMDSANRWQRMLYITLPGVLPTVVTMFTLRVGLVFVTGFDKVLLLYSPTIYDTADCLSTYTYRYGIANSNYGLSAAAGLFQSVIATTLLILSNKLNQSASKRLG
ncbi:MAG: sugar ABC transporter permease [Ruminococcaceae bacterium]|nr:sugar ABC transporter permease [Oscillospiraceae bacterium]